MGKVSIHENCPLARFLVEVSKSDGYDLKAEFAGALLYELGYPHFNLQLPDISYVVQSLQFINEAKQTNLLHQAAEKCAYCPQNGSCDVGPLITIG